MSTHPQDSIYESVNFRLSEVEHRYGKNIHILSDPFLLTLLGFLCSKNTYQPIINQLVETLYSSLVKTIVNREFETTLMQISTRMSESHPNQGVFTGELIDPDQAAVVVNLARAGTFPHRR